MACPGISKTPVTLIKALNCMKVKFSNQAKPIPPGMHGWLRNIPVQRHVLALGCATSIICRTTFSKWCRSCVACDVLLLLLLSLSLLLILFFVCMSVCLFVNVLLLNEKWNRLAVFCKMPGIYPGVHSFFG